MFQTKYRGPLVTAYYSIGSHPLKNWAVQCKDGDLRLVQDDMMKSNVLEIQSQNVNACSITSPINPKGSLGIGLPFVTFLVKNLGRFFTVEITILDSENIRRRFRASSYHSIGKLSTFMYTMPICLNEGWNQLNWDLAQLTNVLFKSTYVETVRIQVHANCRLRRVYFADKLYKDDQLPNEYRMYSTKGVREKPKSMLKKKGVAVDKKPA